MSALAPQAIRRLQRGDREPIDRAIVAAFALALTLLVGALAATVAATRSQAEEDTTAIAVIATTVRADAVARILVTDRSAGRSSNARDHAEFDATLRDPTLALAAPAKLAAVRARGTELLALTNDRNVDGSSPRIARGFAEFEAAVEALRSDVTTATEKRLASVPNEAIGRALTILLAYAIGIAATLMRLRRNRGSTERFTAMLERMLADMARNTVERQETARADVVLQKARGRFVMSVDFRYVVVKPFSEELCEIFDIGDLEGYPFGTLLRRIAPNHDRAALGSLAERLFDPTIHDDALAKHDLGAVVYGDFTLAFAFERIWDRDEIESIVVAVSDISERSTSAIAPAGVDLRTLRDGAYGAFITKTPRPVVDALVTDIAAYSHVLGRTLRSNDMVRQLSKLHEASAILRERLVGLEFAFLADRVASFDARTVELLGRPHGAGADDLSFAIAIAELTADLEALRAVVPRTATARPAG